MIVALLAPGVPVRAQVNPSVEAVISAVNLDTLSLVVNELSGEEPAVINGMEVTIPSRVNTGPVNYAAIYIRQKFASYGYDVHDQFYGSQGRNVYAMKPGDGSSKKYFIICAHPAQLPGRAFTPVRPLG